MSRPVTPTRLRAIRRAAEASSLTLRELAREFNVSLYIVVRALKESRPEGVDTQNAQTTCEKA